MLITSYKSFIYKLIKNILKVFKHTFQQQTTQFLKGKEYILLVFNILTGHTNMTLYKYRISSKEERCYLSV